MDNKKEFGAELAEPSDELNKLAYDVIGAAMEVHRVLGPGLLESYYEEALCIELTLRGTPFIRQRPFAVMYKGHVIGEGRLDLLVKDSIVVELKTVESFAPIHSAQVIAYLRATNQQLGLLINFNVAVLKDGIKRIILSA